MLLLAPKLYQSKEKKLNMAVEIFNLNKYTIILFFSKKTKKQKNNKSMSSSNDDESIDDHCNQEEIDLKCESESESEDVKISFESGSECVADSDDPDTDSGECSPNTKFAKKIFDDIDLDMRVYSAGADHEHPSQTVVNRGEESLQVASDLVQKHFLLTLLFEKTILSQFKNI